jgi:hypothetical protein
VAAGAAEIRFEQPRSPRSIRQQQPVNNSAAPQHRSTARPINNKPPRSTMATITQASEDIVGKRVEVQYVPQPPLPPPPPRSPRAQPMPPVPSVCWPLLPRPPLTRGAAPCPYRARRWNSGEKYHGNITSVNIAENIAHVECETERRRAARCR